MPELPEVEVTARALDARLQGRSVNATRVFQPRLRWPVPKTLGRVLAGQPIVRINRRGKYLLWHLPNGVMISHLGMSGSWRVLERARLPERALHDHIEIECGDLVARYHDPRRFGALLWHARSRGEALGHPLLADLGLEPFDPKFDGDWLWNATRGRALAIKQVLLAGKVVVGVGNIYASESLFEARIHPATPAGKIARARCARLSMAIRHVLQRAIDAGGSTLRDFRGTDGLMGRYTEFSQVYDRAGQACPRCGSKIQHRLQGQRASYFCPACQRL